MSLSRGITKLVGLVLGRAGRAHADPTSLWSSTYRPAGQDVDLFAVSAPARSRCLPPTLPGRRPRHAHIAGLRSEGRLLSAEPSARWEYVSRETGLNPQLVTWACRECGAFHSLCHRASRRPVRGLYTPVLDYRRPRHHRASVAEELSQYTKWPGSDRLVSP